MRIMHITRGSIIVYHFLIPLIEAQKRQGHLVYVCGSDDNEAQKLRDCGIDVFPHHLKRNLNPFGIIKAIFRIKKILVEQKIDVAICHTPIGAGVGRIAARLAKTPNIIYFVHGLPCAPAQNIFVWLVWFCIEKVLGKFTNAVLVMNDYDERLCKTRGLIKDVNKVFRVPAIGVDLKKFNNNTFEHNRRQMEDELGIPPGQKIILCTAYIVREKGVFVLLQAAKQICTRRNDVCFLLAGLGPAIENLKRQCQRYHLDNRFKILGWRDDVDCLMRFADIFVLPTYYFEGLPVSILEAMACGKPVIATRHRGCEDVVVDGKTGFLIPIKDVDALVDKIGLLLDDEQLRVRMGQAGKQRVEEKFELNYCTQTIAQTLENAIQKSPI